VDEICVSQESIGAMVVNAARPEWGVGTVLRVQSAEFQGKAAHRVSIQFAVGHKTLLVPPAKLAPPRGEPQREGGWLAVAGKSTLDDKLRSLPSEATEVLGTPRERLAAVVPLYAYHEDSPSLMRWAINQTGVADPLSHWSRDELLVAFRVFCTERDAHLRNVAATLKQKYGQEELLAALADVPDKLRPGVIEALARPI
jgi:hypothetical protein